MKKKFVVLKNKTDKKPERLLSYDEKYLIAELTQSKNALEKILDDKAHEQSSS